MKCQHGRWRPAVVRGGAALPAGYRTAHQQSRSPVGRDVIIIQAWIALRAVEKHAMLQHVRNSSAAVVAACRVQRLTSCRESYAFGNQRP